jgi:hypothetical protein
MDARSSTAFLFLGLDGVEGLPSSSQFCADRLCRGATLAFRAAADLQFDGRGRPGFEEDRSISRWIKIS